MSYSDSWPLKTTVINASINLVLHSLTDSRRLHSYGITSLKPRNHHFLTRSQDTRHVTLGAQYAYFCVSQHVLTDCTAVCHSLHHYLVRNPYTHRFFLGSSLIPLQITNYGNPSSMAEGTWCVHRKASLPHSRRLTCNPGR